MNKTKKIAIAVASLVMAGTMALGIVGCGGGGGGSSAAKPKLDENGKLTYTDNIALNLNIGNSNSDSKQGIAFNDTDISGRTNLPDGKSYGAGSLKPAWQAVSDLLKITLTDDFQNASSDAQITTPVGNHTEGDYDLISGSLSAIAANADRFVNLTDYLDYMPNYKAFLDANPVTVYSLTGDMGTGMYAAPYFDGNDDIEKYVLTDYNLVSKVLADEYTNTKTYKSQLEAKKTKVGATSEAGVALGDGAHAYATAYMGTTGNYTVATTKTTGSDVGSAKVDYTAAHTAATTSGQALYEAINTAAGEAYSGESGNIVDLQNWAIEKSAGEVTGAQLAKILTEYIKVAYTIDGVAYSKPEDVFLSQAAAWDVDLLVGLSRAVICDGDDGLQYGIAARETTTQRRVDLTAFAGELYGIRGLESRYEYAYIDDDGNLQDARANGETYELLKNMSNLAKEGIVHIGGLGSDGKKTSVGKGNKTSGERTLMLHDYLQTQTKDGIAQKGGSAPALTSYNFAPIVTPVSKWDVDGDGTHSDIMRFTESWRSVKNTGFAIPKAAVDGNAEKLSAILTLIDYMFSNDGQILLSYGTQSTVGNTDAPNGFWYATTSSKTLDTVADKVADAYGHVPAQYKVKAAEKTNVFVYNGQVLEGMQYSDRNIPKVTDINDKLFRGEEVTIGGAAVKQGVGNLLVNKVADYTNYARYIIGSTLPVGNKDQGYEFQSTAACGITGGQMVNISLQNGTIKHVKLTLDEGESYWYMICPTALPMRAGDRTTWNGSAQSAFGNLFYNNSGVGQIFNVALDVLYYGLGRADVKPCGKTDTTLGENYSAYATGEALATKLNSDGLTTRLGIMRTGWNSIKSAYDI